MRREMDLAQLRDLAASVGFPDDQLDTAAAIAMAESGGNPNAYNTEGSYGLWQIHLVAHPSYDAQSLFDPTYNAKAALAVSSGGTNWKPWTTYGYDRQMHFVGWGQGYYQEYMPAVPTTPPTSSGGLSTTKALWISAGILAAGGGALWWLTRTPREKRRIRRMLPV